MGLGNDIQDVVLILERSMSHDNRINRPEGVRFSYGEGACRDFAGTIAVEDSVFADSGRAVGVPEGLPEVEAEF